MTQRYSQSKNILSGKWIWSLRFAPHLPRVGKEHGVPNLPWLPFFCLFPSAFFFFSPSFPPPPLDNLDPVHVLANFISERRKKGAPGCSMLEESS